MDIEGKEKGNLATKTTQTKKIKRENPKHYNWKGKTKEVNLPAVSLVGCGNRLVKTVICSISSNFTMSILAEGKKESITGKKIFEAMLTINKEADP